MKRFNGIALSVAFCSLASQAALAQTKIDTLKVQNLNDKRRTCRKGSSIRRG